MEDKILMYYASSDERHYGWRNSYFNLATLRPDGFAGYSTVERDRPGMVLTKPVMSSGSRLRVSADVDRGGYIRASIDGHQTNTLKVCEPITSSVTDALVAWKGGGPLPKRPVALRFELSNARLYSFGFGD